jgi:hypothetical protein
MDTIIDPATPRPFEKKRNMVLATPRGRNSSYVGQQESLKHEHFIKLA